MGRRPEPPELKIVKGTFRADRDAPPLSGQPECVVAPPPPSTLKALGKRVWTRTAALLLGVRVLTELDLGALETYCRAHDEVARLDKVLRRQGEYFQTEQGYVGQHPAVNQRFKWLDIKRRYEIEFGLTAASRPGVGAAQKSDKAVGIQPRKRG